MKTINSLGKVEKRNDFAFIVEKTRKVVLDACFSLEEARQSCLAAGHALIEAREALDRRGLGAGEDGFTEWVKKTIPEITLRTAQLWMRAAANVARALPPVPADDSIDVEVSEILTKPEEELTPDERKWRQQWLDFTKDKTIKDCLDGVLVDGDEGHRVDRAINGKTKGGAGGDRKDFPVFVMRKLKEVGSHLGHWDGMDANQRNEVLTVFTAAILGEFCSLHGRKTGKAKFECGWPEEVCESVMAVLKKRVRR